MIICDDFMVQNYKIRHASIEDLDEIVQLEMACFSKEEAASREAFEKRLKVYSDYFWLLLIDNKIVSMVNGMVSDSPVLVDEMYTNSLLHNSSGKWQMIFGVETRPEYRKRGYADALLRAVIEDVKGQSREGIVLTCKKELIPYYERFGFVNEGLSESKHGGETWYQMRLTCSTTL